MAQLANNPHPTNSTRVSQVLPTVKCSNCSSLVPLTELGDHICVSVPPVPTFHKPTVLPPSPTSLLPPRLQTLVQRPPQSLSPVSTIATQRPPRRDNLRSNPTSPTNPLPSSVSARWTPQSSEPRKSPSPVPNQYGTSPSPASRMPTRRVQHLRSPSNTRPSYESTLGSTTSPEPREPELDTKSGGEAGMAGVGRRGFAAAARAAMFAVSSSGFSKPSGDFSMPSMAGRRPNPPQFLDINAATNSSSHSTPPLSPNYSSQSSSAGPLSPSPISLTGHHPNTSRSPSPSTQHRPSGASHISAHRPSSDKYNKTVPIINSPKSNRKPDPLSTTSISNPNSAVHSSTTDKSQVNGDNSAYTTSTSSSANILSKIEPSPASPVSSYGLAYSDSESEDDVASLKAKMPLTPSILRSPISSNVRLPSISDRSRARAETSSAKDRFSGHSSGSSSGSPIAGRNRSNSAAIALALGLKQGSSFESEGRYSGGPGSPARTRSGASFARGAKVREERDTSGSSVYSTRSGAEVTAMEAAVEDEAESSTLVKSKSTSSAANPLENRPVKLPTRSHTSPTHLKDGERVRGVVAAAGEDVERVKSKVCVRCERKIEGGRWVQMDTGGVLCERCWKNMYLPKCRRCNLTIEKQAVSSSDGQLKGKYHRECFDCHKCHKPFPDKSFYVFDGKPLCAYHYHEANNSLCAASTCGEPIEGPCAVSHTGDRFHPEHLLCEHPGYPRCRERLVEYYELDGRMVCERHAGGGKRDSGGSGYREEEEKRERDFSQSVRAKKRLTRFIDLAGGR